MNLSNPSDEIHCMVMHSPEVTAGLGQTYRLGFS